MWLQVSLAFFQCFKEELEDVSPLGVGCLEEVIRRDRFMCMSQISSKSILNGSNIFLRVWESHFLHLNRGHNSTNIIAYAGFNSVTVHYKYAPIYVTCNVTHSYIAYVVMPMCCMHTLNNSRVLAVMRS